MNHLQLDLNPIFVAKRTVLALIKLTMLLIRSSRIHIPEFSKTDLFSSREVSTALT
uniref:Uncharacterized protein n=1 Tax=Rhizophora mucronata TaxID=61149 RepID=A0A2P2Q1L1_RHIMU